MSLKHLLLVLSFIVLQCSGFSFQASANPSECAAKLENPLTAVRARIMPVGQVASVPVGLDSLTHKTADGRELQAVVESARLEVLVRYPEETQTVMEKALTSSLEMTPVWFRLDDGDSALIYVEERVLRLEFPASRRVPIEYSGLPKGVQKIRVLRSGADEYLLLLTSTNGQNEILSWRQNELHPLTGFQSRPGTPVVLVSDGYEGGEIFAISTSLRYRRDSVQISSVSQPGAFKTILPLSPGEKVLNLQVVGEGANPVLHVMTGRQTYSVELSFSRPQFGDHDEGQSENSDE